MRNRMYGGVRGRKTKVGRKLLRFPPTRSRPNVTAVKKSMKGFDRRARERSELGGRGRGIAADGPRHTQPTQGWRDGGRGGFLKWRACERTKKYGCAGYLGFNKNNGLRPQKHADESALKNNAALKKWLARREGFFGDSENNPKMGRKESENICLRMDWL